MEFGNPLMSARAYVRNVHILECNDRLLLAFRSESDLPPRIQYFGYGDSARYMNPLQCYTLRTATLSIDRVVMAEV